MTTDLTSADFSGARLMRANMEGSKLEGAIFKGALMPYGTKHPQHDALREVWLRGVSLRGILAVMR